VAGENNTLDIYQELINRDAVPAEHQETVGELVRRGVLKARAPKEAPVGGVEGTLRQFNDALTFGFYDKAVAGAKSLFGGGNYDENVKRERSRTQEAGNQTLPWLVGQTAGNVVQGLATLPAAPAVYSYEAAHAAMRPATNALMQFAEGIPEAARYGAAYGGANALGHADGSLGNQIGDLAQGTAAGAALGPLVYSGMYGAGAALGAKQRWAERRADANQARLDEARAVGIDNPIPGIVSDSGVVQRGTRMVGAGIGGNPIGARAAENIDQLTSNLNRTLAKPIGGQEAGDLGRSVQGDLRRALTMPSRTPEEIASMSKADLEGIAGPLTTEGFQPQRPNVSPVQPRQIEAVQPRDVGPAPEAPAIRERLNSLQNEFAARERDIAAATAEHNTLLKSRADIEARYKPTFDAYQKLVDEEKTILKTIEDMNRPGAINRMRKEGETVPQFMQRRDVDLPRQHQELIAKAKTMQADIDLAQRAMSRFGNPEERIARIRSLHERKNMIESRLAAARAQEAADNVSFAKAQEDYSAAKTRAAADAAEETARLQEQAQIEARQATTEAQRAAEARYQRQIADGNAGFKVGGSKESYPTELSAAYELAYREAPKIRVNPLGNGYVGTNTTKLLESVAREGKRNLSIRDFDGKPFDADTGGLAAPFKTYLRSRLGNDMAERIEALAEIRSRGIVAQPALDGMKSLLSDMRALAREAEKSRYSPQPRTEDAALLRRLSTTIQRDLYDTLARAGRPESFKTASGDYKVLDGGRTQFGDKAPTDATYYVSPENFQRLTRGTGKADSTYSIPATLSLKAEKGQIGYFKNREGEFDRSSLIPFSQNPEPGMVPIQVWADGTRITYGSPVISRATTSGERAVSMFKNVDEQYSQYVSELRKPLSKVFGDNVNGVQALDRLVDAAKKGETGLLGSYMRVMTEKSDPTKGASAVIYHMTGGGKDLKNFMEAWRELHPSSKRILFDSPQGRQLERELNQFVNVGQRLEKFVNASRQKALVNPTRVTHLLTAAAVYTNLPAVVAMVGGNAMAAKVLSSPRLVRWMTELPKIGRGGFDTKEAQAYIARLGGMGGKDKPAADVLSRAVMQAIAIGPAKAGRMDQEYDPAADAELQREGMGAVERPTPVPPFVPPQAFRDAIYVNPPRMPGDGLNREDRPFYWQREIASEKLPRMIGR